MTWRKRTGALAALLLSAALACGCSMELPQIQLAEAPAAESETDSQAQATEPTDAAEATTTTEAADAARQVPEETEDATRDGSPAAETDFRPVEGGESGAVTQEQVPAAASAPYRDAWAHRDGYTLKEVVAVSRHNLRARVDKDRDLLEAATTHEWVALDAGDGELTDKGGIAETLMGQFFRHWLEGEGLIPANYVPEVGQVRIYANARQRTVSTAHYFSSGMLPVGNAVVEYHGGLETRDPVFTSKIDIDTESYREAATSELLANLGIDDMSGFDADLAASYDLIMDVCGYRDTPAYASGSMRELVTGDSSLAIELGESPAADGSLQTASKLSDALILQYLVSDDDSSAAFGRTLTPEQWDLIAAPKNASIDRALKSELLSVDCSHKLIRKVEEELREEGRVFTFLGCRDSNLSALLNGLGVKEYDLPDTLEAHTPMGSKILFERWENAAGEQFANIRMVYATTDQLRHLEPLTLETPPASFDLSFDELVRNADGLFDLRDVYDLMDEKLDLYDEIQETYGEDAGETDQAA